MFVAGKYEASPVARPEGDVQIATDQYGNVKTVGAGTAGSPSGGVQTVQGYAYSSTVSFNRTADTNPYAANDAVGSSTGAGGAVLSFTNAGPSGGGEVTITSASLEIDVNAVPSGMTTFRLYFYSGTPNSNLGDNGAWDLTSGDRATFLKYIDLGAPVDLGSTLYVQADGLGTQITVPSGGALTAYLVTAGAYTPASGTTYKINLKAAGF